MYKIAKGLEGLKFEAFLNTWRNQQRNISTKGHQFKLFKRRFRLEYGMHSFSNRVVDEWNRLPDNAVTAEGLNSLKGTAGQIFEQD